MNGLSIVVRITRGTMQEASGAEVLVGSAGAEFTSLTSAAVRRNEARTTRLICILIDAKNIGARCDTDIFSLTNGFSEGSKEKKFCEKFVVLRECRRNLHLSREEAHEHYIYPPKVFLITVVFPTQPGLE